MSVHHIDLLTKLETTCGRLLLELQKIWVEVGETDDTKESMLLEIERQCLDVYRKRVDHAYQCRAQKRQAIADSEAELVKIYSTLGIHPMHIMQSDQKAANLKEELNAVISGLEDMRKKKKEREKQFTDILEHINNILIELYSYPGEVVRLQRVDPDDRVLAIELEKEIFPLRMIGRGLSIAVLVNFSANALVTFSFSPRKALIGAGNVFFVFGVIAVLSLFFIFYVIPETKGLSLEEIEAKIG